MHIETLLPVISLTTNTKISILTMLLLRNRLEALLRFPRPVKFRSDGQRVMKMSPAERRPSSPCRLAIPTSFKDKDPKKDNQIRVHGNMQLHEVMKKK